jgi:hypothetical protein
MVMGGMAAVSREPPMGGSLLGERAARINRFLVFLWQASSDHDAEPCGMSRPIDDVKNWMHMFRWIVKLIRDEYDIDESILNRTAVLETDCGLVIDQVEALLAIIADSFQLHFPEGTLDEVVKLEELCMLTAWLKGLYKRPEFISEAFDGRCRASNPACA